MSDKDTERAMTLSEYQAEALDYCRQGGVTLAFGLAEEAGEAMGVLKRMYRGDYNSELTRRKLCEELGDTLWYLAMLAYSYGIDLNEIAAENLWKLEGRAERGTLLGSGDR